MLARRGEYAVNAAGSGVRNAAVWGSAPRYGTGALINEGTPKLISYFESYDYVISGRRKSGYVVENKVDVEKLNKAKKRFIINYMK